MNTDTKPEKKLLTIALTDKRPVTIIEENWPIVAHVSEHDSQYECQANRWWRLRVRQHADGRAIVYGSYSTQFQNEHDRRAGERVESGGDVESAIFRVAESLDFDQRLAQECIADLPPDPIDEE